MPVLESFGKAGIKALLIGIIVGLFISCRVFVNNRGDFHRRRRILWQVLRHILRLNLGLNLNRRRCYTVTKTMSAPYLSFAGSL